MEYIYVLIFSLLIFISCSFISYKIIKNKFMKLFLLDKRQQEYIKDLVNYDTKLAILQRLLFCVILTIYRKTHQLGLKQINKHFNIPVNAQNADELINYFIQIYNKKNISFKLQNGKYTIISDSK